MIETRPILKYSNKLSVIFDCDSLMPDIEKGCKDTINLLKYHSVEGITSLITTPLNDDTIFSKIESVQIHQVVEGTDIVFILSSNPKEGDTAVFVEKERLLKYSKKYLRSNELSPQVARQIGPFFYYMHLPQKNCLPLLITSNPKMLKNRHNRRVKDPDFFLTILDPKEGSIFINLFFKNQNKFFITPSFTTSQNHWYDLLTCLKIPHLFFGKTNPILMALFNKYKFALMAVDKIGFQNYELGNLIGQDETLYNLNNLLTLIAGIFDNISLSLVPMLNITNIKQEHISLRNDGNFIKSLKKAPNGISEEFVKILDEHGIFISLIYSIRDIMVHQAGLKMVTYSEDDIAKITWKNLLNITETLPNLKSQILNYCSNTSNSKESILIQWGFLLPPSKFGDLLHPFTFAIKIINETAIICDKFLEQMHKMNLDVPYYSEHFKEFESFKDNYFGL